MLIVGLTGSIGMGKSTAAARFRHNGVAVFDADAAVHRLYEHEAVALVEAAFPGTTADGTVDRQKLSAALGGEREKFARLEAIVHPLVRAAERDFLLEQEQRGADMAVLEVPLLYETGLDEAVDAVVVVSAPAEIQRQRVLERPGMTQIRLDEILARQLPDDDKRRRATFVVDTSKSVEASGAEIDSIYRKLLDMSGSAIEEWRMPP